MFGDSFFKRVEKKTNINKETILSLSDKLQRSNMTGKEVSKEKEQRIIDAIKKDNIPKDIGNMF